MVEEVVIGDPVYLEKDYTLDDGWLVQLRAALVEQGEATVELGDGVHLSNRNKSVGGQLAIDIERMLNHELDRCRAARRAPTDERGRRYLRRRQRPDRHVRVRGPVVRRVLQRRHDPRPHRHLPTTASARAPSGGSIVVRSPGGGSDAGGNVLIGNFALFGATGGRTFVEGQAGDRFAVRNSGATAVVEGVGDFACEYMTNGAVLNLGGFGKGVGNGMSGGFVYQYDPDGRAGRQGQRATRSCSARSPVTTSARRSTGRPCTCCWVARRGDRLRHWRPGCSRTGRPSSTTSCTACRARCCSTRTATRSWRPRPARSCSTSSAAALAAHQVRKFKLDYRDGARSLGGACPATARPTPRTCSRC